MSEPSPPVIDIILDADPEIYRLGYGDVLALEFLREHCACLGQGIRLQEGVRIGILVAD